MRQHHPREARGRRSGRWLLAVAGILALAGCGSDQSALEPESGAASDIATLWWVMFVGSLVVLGVVLVLIGIAVLRRRSDPDDPPGRLGGSLLPLVGGAAVPAVVLVVLFAFVLSTMASSSTAASGDPALTVAVTARQWFWDVDYPGRAVRTANEIHIPSGVPVRLELKSGDVIHSFWVPRLARKLDAIPGRTNALVLKADRPGVYRGQCAEFCGLAHARMAFLVVAEPRADFDAWLRDQARPSAVPRTQRIVGGQQVFMSSACVYCHTIAGTNASGRIGPDLTHLASRRSLGAGRVPNTRGYLAAWILDPQHLKRGNKMPATDLTGSELQGLLDYLETLE